ncbi:TroA family protein [Lactiplantibacillus plantarum]|uniref:hypothetical protein n=1 Tax=Lactiplantibacillus plantarum TaxID=1590 RepID=UPI0021CB3F6F|nr:hypothetical protein [Lactiplantibacillus plantarum]
MRRRIFMVAVAKLSVGKHVSVTSIINKPSVDPNDLSQHQPWLRGWSGLSLVIANGIGYDGWMNKVVHSTQRAKLISGRRGRDASQGRG